MCICNSFSASVTFLDLLFQNNFVTTQSHWFVFTVQLLSGEESLYPGTQGGRSPSSNLTRDTAWDLPQTKDKQGTVTECLYADRGPMRSLLHD